MLDKLQQLRELLTPPENWTQGAVSRDREGRAIGTAAHPDSICYCLIGGIQKICPDSLGDRYLLQESLCYSIHQRFQGFPQSTKFKTTTNIADFNDHPETNHEQILQLIDYTIDRIAA